MSPAVRRRANIALHWSLVFALLVMVEGGSAAPAVRWAYVAIAVLWLALTLTHGMLARPGPKLRGAVRALFVPMHWGLHGLIAVSAGLNAGELVGVVPPGPAWTSLLVLLSAAAFHAIFHIWRHGALYDNALRLITPRFIHKYL